MSKVIFDILEGRDIPSLGLMGDNTAWSAYDGVVTLQNWVTNGQGQECISSEVTQ